MGGHTKYLTLFVLFTLLVPSISAINLQNPELVVTLFSQSPNPVEPGQVVKLQFQVTNNGQITNDDIILRVREKYPFSAYGPIEKNIGRIRSNSQAKTVDFEIKVDENAVETQTELEVELEYGGNKYLYVNNEFMIDIQTHDAVLSVQSINMEPKQLAPGGTATLDFIVKNIADSLLKDVRFKLDFTATTLPFAPYKSSSERIIDQINSGFQESMQFSLVADPEATPGLYKLPLTITYNDEQGNSTKIEDIVAIQIGDLPKLRPYIKKSTVLKSGSAGQVTIELANAGTTDVKLVELYLQESQSYRLLSASPYFYIGDVDADDTESEEINIYVNEDIDRVLIPVKLVYHDANNQEFSQEFELDLSLYSQSQLEEFGLVEKSSSVFYIVLIVIIAGGIIWYRRRKNTKA